MPNWKMLQRQLAAESRGAAQTLIAELAPPVTLTDAHDMIEAIRVEAAIADDDDVRVAARNALVAIDALIALVDPR